MKIEKQQTTTTEIAITCSIANTYPPPPEKPLQKLVVVIAIILSATFNAHSATLTVTNENNAGSGSLRERIASANSGDVIVFASNVNYITLTSGEIEITKNLTINGGSGSARVTLDGNNNSRIFAVYNSTNNVTININNLTLTKGRRIDYWDGGAIYFSGLNSSFTAKNCTFSRNSVIGNGSFGGAIHITSGTFTADGCTFTENSAGREGGAVCVYDYNESSNPTFIATNCIFSGNFTTEGGGGGAVSTWYGTFIADNCTFSGNYTPIYDNYCFGGALYIADVTILTNCTFNGNSSWCGGAIMATIIPIDAYLTIINCTFSGNSATYGGAIATDMDNVYMYLYHNTFDGNRAPNGNAINSINSIFGTPPAHLYSYNCVYTGNHPQILGPISAGENLIEGINATRNPIFGTNLFNGRFVIPLPFAKSAEQLDNTIQVPPGMSVDEILKILATDQIGNPRPQ